MGLIDISDVKQLTERALALEIPTAPRRRSGSDAAFDSALEHVQRSFQEIYRYAVEVGGSNEDELRWARTDRCIETASILFSAGAQPELWRSWAAVAAKSLLAYDDPQPAAVWAVIAHTEEVLRLLPPAPLPAGQPGTVVWWLAGLQSAGPSSAISNPAPAERPTDEVDNAWVTLTYSIPAADHPATNRALRGIADFWQDEVPSWEEFRPGYYPDFDPELNAAATLARRSGWVPVNWPPSSLRYLEPALADGPMS